VRVRACACACGVCTQHTHTHTHTHTHQPIKRKREEVGNEDAIGDSITPNFRDRGGLGDGGGGGDGGCRAPALVNKLHRLLSSLCVLQKAFRAEALQAEASPGLVDLDARRGGGGGGGGGGGATYAWGSSHFDVASSLVDMAWVQVSELYIKLKSKLNLKL
jgi:hypothetical protein